MTKRLDRNILVLVVFHFFEYWYFYLVAIASLVVLHYTQSMLPQMAKELGDTLISNQSSSKLVLPFIGFAVLIIIFRTLSRLFFFYPARVQQQNLRMEIFEVLELAHPDKYAQYNDGDLYQRIINDINRIRGLVGFGLLQAVNVLIAGIIIVPKVIDFNASFLIAFLPLILSIFIFMALVYFVHPYIKKDMELTSIVQNFIIETYDAKASIKNHHAENSFLEIFDQHSERQLSRFFKSHLARMFGGPLIRLGFGLSLLGGAYIVWQQDLGATSLIFFSSFLFLVLEPLMYMSWIWIALSAGIAGLNRVQELWRDINKKEDLSWAIGQKPTHPNFKFWDQQIELNIVKNSMTVLVGETGCGKSYSLKKIADILSANDFTYSFISQEPYLYNDSIRDNIFLGQKITDQKKALAIEFLELFGLDVLSENTNEILDIEVGENGKKLSGGQAKRVSLIRSIVSDVEYIIWDDPFSSVDFLLEKKILEKILQHPILCKKTFIFSSHRLSTVNYCDYLILLDKRQGVAEAGDVKTLLNSESKAREFFKKQMV
ncbi:hypothetical protein BVY03_02295 [bacterium K02(2017)]|nr:hypothetical protein BVY03_02295 [bacterium K02(2017)]